MSIDWNRQLESAIETSIRNAPQIAIALLILWRIVRRQVGTVKDAVNSAMDDVKLDLHAVQAQLDGRISELKEGLVAKGILQGMQKATELAREDRREFKEALLTPAPIQRLPPSNEDDKGGKQD